VKLWLNVELFLFCVSFSFTEIGMMTFTTILSGRGKPTILRVCT